MTNTQLYLLIANIFIGLYVKDKPTILLFLSSFFLLMYAVTL
jgi:hypothetical protein